MKLKRKIAAALLGVMVAVTAFPAGVANATEVNSYTYNYDYWGLEYESPDAYQPVSYTDGKALGITAAAVNVCPRHQHLCGRYRQQPYR